ncbi:hypothetical protein H5410_004244 [Solanum commersonii]|uniref:Uncharacterized protein n=1 Tax=Solanum commersonii TaxID=4109 RepID=A0A9J6B7Y9_SOLCO|nr:hypothetical protein H5410_004244 [Solanum commersonii]
MLLDPTLSEALTSHPPSTTEESDDELGEKAIDVTTGAECVARIEMASLVLGGYDDHSIWIFVKCDPSWRRKHDIYLVRNTRKPLIQNQEFQKERLSKIGEKFNIIQRSKLQFMALNNILGDSKCDGLSDVMVEMTLVDDTSTLVPYKIKGDKEAEIEGGGEEKIDIDNAGSDIW